jgi:glycosyl transferase family 25
LIYIINLDKRIERLKYLDRRFRQVGKEFIRISAIDGASLDDQFFLNYKNYIDLENSPVLTNKEILRPNQIGCSLSHFKIYVELIQSKDEFCIILEDDIDFSHEFIEMTQEINPEIINKEACIIMFGYYKKNNRIESSNKSFLFPNRKRLTSKIDCFKPIEWYFGSHGYIINKEAAKIILETFEYPTLPADYLLTYSPKLGIKLFMTEFPLVWINDFGLETSDIQLTNEQISELSRKKIKFGPRSFLKYIVKKKYIFLNSIYTFFRINCTKSKVPFYIKKMPIHD